MTEYDYSPDAWDRYLETQHRIARWVDGTMTQAPCNAFDPATPHIKFLEIQQEEKRQRKDAKTTKERPSRERRHSYDVRYRDPKPKNRSDTEEDEEYPKSTKRRSRKTSTSQVSGTTSRRYESSPPPPLPSRQKPSSKEHRRDRSERRSSLQTTSRPREREAAPLQGQGYVLVEKSRTTQNTPTSSRASTPTSAVATRPRSSSAAPRPSRTQANPNLSLDLGSSQDAYYYRYPRNSVDGNSSNTRPSSGSTTNGTFYPQQHQPVYPTQLGAPPNSAPAVMRHAPQPVRSYTLPLVGHPSGQYGHGHVSGYPGPTVSPDPSKVPQIPYSAYTSSPTKANQSTSLLKRMFTGLAIHRHSTSPKPKPPPSPSKYRESANGSGMQNGGRRILRKRSSSF